MASWFLDAARREAARQEAARDGATGQQSTTTSAPPVDARPDDSPTVTIRSDDSPAMALNPDMVVGPLVFKNSGTHEDGRNHDSSSYRSDVGPELNGRISLPSLSSQTKSCQLEATIPSRNIANKSSTMLQPIDASQASSERQGEGLRKISAPDPLGPSNASPLPLWHAKVSPSTVIHHPKAANKINANEGSADRVTGDDPFFGTGPALRRHFSANSASTRRRATDTPSPSPVRLQNSQVGGSPGLLSLHDANNEVLSLLDTLKSRHRDQIKMEVDAALRRCQKDMKARSKDKTIGTAEANILDREAARIGRARDEASKKAPGAYGACSPVENVEGEDNLRLALAKLVRDARAALEAIAEAKSQAASASSRGQNKNIPYRVGEEFRMTALDLENRTLSERVERLQAENEQVHRVNSDLHKRLDELELKGIKAGHPEQTVPSKLGPWGKEWNIDDEKEE